MVQLDLDLDPDPLSEKLMDQDPDPHKMNADPQPWRTHWLNVGYYRYLILELPLACLQLVSVGGGQPGQPLLVLPSLPLFSLHGGLLILRLGKHVHISCFT